MRCPLLDSFSEPTGQKFLIPFAKPYLNSHCKSYVADALESSWISQGPYLDRFERDFLKQIGGRHGIALSSGTAAVFLAMQTAGLKPGDEVIVPGFSFACPANMAIALGATPVYAEVLEDTWCLDPQSVETLIGPRTRMIVAVHTYGNVCDMAALMSIAARHKLVVIEDAAEAVFSRYNGQYAGTLGDWGCFSFHAAKTIAMGEGGFLLAPDALACDQILLKREHGMRKGHPYRHELAGYNFRLTNLQAALGCAQLECAGEIIRLRQQVYGWYRQRLEGCPGITMQAWTVNVQPVVWSIALRLDPNVFKGGRDFVMAQLALAGIESRPGFFPFRTMPVYQAPVLPVTEKISSEIIVLPFFPSMTEEEIETVCTNLQRLAASSFYGKNGG